MKSNTRHTLYAPQPATTAARRRVRKTLNADTLFQLVRQDFREVVDHRAANAKVPPDDARVSALAMFQLKDPSLLAFDQRRIDDADNLRDCSASRLSLATINCAPSLTHYHWQSCAHN